MLLNREVEAQVVDNLISISTALLVPVQLKHSWLI